MKNKKVLKKEDEKNIKVEKSKGGISIVIKNEVQQPQEAVTIGKAIQEKKKKRRKRIIKKDNLDLLKMSSAPSYTPPGNIPKTQQYRGSSIIGPTQSQLQQQLLTAHAGGIVGGAVPPPQQLLPPPPQLLQITAPPQAQPQSRPITFNFQGGYNPMMPMEWGGGNGPIITELPDDDVISALPEDKQEEFTNKQIEDDVDQKIEKSNVSKTLNLTEDEKQALKEATFKRKQGKQWGTKDSNLSKEPREKYRGNEFYKTNYKNGIERQLKNTKLTADERTKLNRLLGLINVFEKKFKNKNI